ncbi:MAG TPA: hypothetical protein VFF39_18050, partial [Verrucomicrobiae bacterium]|nr:hypothetical protein [Verrucomicrobiae bacterium]
MKQAVGFCLSWIRQLTIPLALGFVAQVGQTKQSNAQTVPSAPQIEDAGILQLNRGYPNLARDTCATTLTANPKNEMARKCLDDALVELEKREAGAQERTLAQAESLLHLGKKTEALAAVEKIQPQIRRPDLIKKALSIVNECGELSVLDRVRQPLSEAGIGWVLDVVTGVAIIALFYWTLKFLRYLKRTRRAYKNRTLRLRTHWRVMAIEDQTKASTSSFVLSAYDSLKSHLSDSSNPILLFVPPFTGCGSTKCVIEKEFKTGVGRVQEPATFQAKRPEGFLELKLQNFEFLDAVKALGVKVGGTDFAGVGNFVAGIGKWFNAGLPTLTGSAFEDGDGIVVSVTCSDATRYATLSAKGSDKSIRGAQEAAESAVYKMLYFLGHEGSSTRDADAAADLRKQSRELQKY